jgi:foldase protein PrsA
VIQPFKRGAAIASLSLCAAFGAALSGCNGNNAVGGVSSAGGGDTIATVGGSKVTRGDMASFLEAQQGEQILPYLIDTQLIFEELKKKGMDVSDAEVDADLARREETDPSVKALVTAGGPKLIAAKAQIKRDLAVTKLLTADVKVTDDQLKTFFQKNSRYYDQPAKVKVGILFSSTKVRADLMSRELTKKTKTFEALVAEQLKANDQAAKQSTPDRGTFESLQNFPAPIAAQLTKLPKGAATTPQSLNVGLPTPVFIIFKKLDFQPAKKADLTNMKTQIENDYKLYEIAKKTAGENPANPPFEQTLERTQQYIQSQNPGGPAPRLRDVLGFINQTAANTLLTKLRSEGTVQVDDPNYAKVAQAYQAAPAAGAAAGGASNSASAPAANAAPAAAPAANAAPATP